MHGKADRAGRPGRADGIRASAGHRNQRRHAAQGPTRAQRRPGLCRPWTGGADGRAFEQLLRLLSAGSRPALRCGRRSAGSGHVRGAVHGGAQTAIKSQMRSGAPLTEAMTAVNRQLHEIGRGLALNVLVGVLDEDGVFSFINAGQRAPLLMRDQDRYEWLKAPVYAPLGRTKTWCIRSVRSASFRGPAFSTRRGWTISRGGRQAVCGETAGCAEHEPQPGPGFGGPAPIHRRGGESLAKSLGKSWILPPRCSEYRRSSRILPIAPFRGPKGAAKVTDFLKQQLAANG